MKILLILHGISLLALFVTLWVLDRLTHQVMQLRSRIDDAFDVPEGGRTGAAPSWPHVAGDPRKCRVWNCGWPPVDDGYCEQHAHERPHANE